MTIHNLTADANVLFASDSITDILGYLPSEVQGKSCFDYFHPEEVPFARTIHSRGVRLDKAAVLHYARILSRDGRWIGCECCFTVVHDVLVACVSIYNRGAKSKRRAIEAPQIRRLFSCSPRDPRYHMLEHLSPKFKMPPMEREPRAALIVNRFTRNLTVMFATNAISTVVGLRPDQIKNKSFYRCIQESCLSDAIECLESAKANDSIAYLRFNFQDPRDDEEIAAEADSVMELPDEGGADGQHHMQMSPGQLDIDMSMDIDADINSRNLVHIKAEEEDDRILSLPNIPYHPPQLSAADSEAAPQPSRRLPSIELEAVVSCTSDGLVVVLRKARPPIPPAHPPLVAFNSGDGLFAAPWAQQPIRPHIPIESLYTFRPPLLPQYMPLRDNVKEAGGPPLDVLMGSIRDVAVFAWGVVGINPAMAEYGHGLPSGEARPNEDAQNQHQHRHRHGQHAQLGEASGSSAVDKGKAPAVPGSLYGNAYVHEGSSSSGYRPPPPAAFTPRASSCNLPPAWTLQAGNSSSTFGASSSSHASYEYAEPPLRQNHGPEPHPFGGMGTPNFYYDFSNGRNLPSFQQTAAGMPPSMLHSHLGTPASEYRYRGWDEFDSVRHR